MSLWFLERHHSATETHCVSLWHLNHVWIHYGPLLIITFCGCSCSNEKLLNVGLKCHFQRVHKQHFIKLMESTDISRLWSLSAN